MNKILIILGITLISMMSVVSAVTVDCGTDHNKCDELELQPFFDEVEAKHTSDVSRIGAVLREHNTDLATLESDVDTMEAKHTSDVSRIGAVLREHNADLTTLESDVDANEKVDAQQTKRINNVNRKTKVNANDIDGLQSTIADNSASWATDRSGTSMRNVIKYVTGEFTDWLFDTFALKSDVVEYDERFYTLEAKVQLLSEDLPLTDENIKMVSDLLKSEDGIAVDGCMNGLCVSIN